MWTYIDNLLSRTTMYRLALYYLVTLVIGSIALSGAGVMPYAPEQIALTAVCAVIFGYVFNWFFVILFRAKQNPESRFITALILALIMGPVSGADSILSLFVASFVASGSKYVLVHHKRHILNPAAIGVLTAALFFGRGPSWWIGDPYILPIIVIGGLLIARKTQRTIMVATFLAVYITSAAIVSGITGSSSEIVVRVLANPLAFAPVFFFAFVMLLEPMTSPQSRRMQYAYATLVGVLGIAYGFVTATAPYALELALLSGNIFSRIFLASPFVALRLLKKEDVAMHTTSFWFTPSRPIAFTPGQFMQWELPHSHPDDRGTRRFFTIASSPTEQEIMLTTKFAEPSSTFKDALRHMQKGDAMTALNVAGDFVLPKDDGTTPCVFIAGGIGVTPFRSMIKYMLDKNLSRPITLLYSTKTVDDIAFKSIFDEAVAAGWLKAVYTITEAIPYGWRGRTGYITADMIKEEVPDYMNSIFYVSGPQPMVVAFEKLLSEIGIPAQQIKTDYFPGYAETHQGKG